jgi:SAM-dependent methyltransferase
MTVGREAAGLGASSFQYESTELHALAAAENYRHGILRYFAPHLGKRIVEVGAGLGAFSSALLSEAQPDELVLLEPADNLIPVLRNRFADAATVSIVHGYLDRLASRAAVDSVVMVNVLEHIEDDAGALRAVHALLRPGGALLLFVPAFPSLFGSMDRAFGHVRRYTKPVLAARLAEAGYKLTLLRYFNCLGIAPWLVTGRLLKRDTLRLKEVGLYDRWVLPALLTLEGICEPPVGLSLIAVATRPAD